MYRVVIEGLPLPASNCRGAMAILRKPVLTQLIHRKTLQLKGFPVNQPKHGAAGGVPFRPDGFALRQSIRRFRWQCSIRVSGALAHGHNRLRRGR